MRSSHDFNLLSLTCEQLKPKDLVQIHLSAFLAPDGSIEVSESMLDALKKIRQAGAEFEIFPDSEQAIKNVWDLLKEKELPPASLSHEPENIWIIGGPSEDREKIKETLQSAFKPGLFNTHQIPSLSEILFGKTTLDSEDERLLDALWGRLTLAEMSQLDLNRSQIERLLTRLPTIEQNLYQLNQHFKKGAAEPLLQDFFDRVVYLQRHFCPTFKLNVATHPAKNIYTAAGVFPIYRTKDPQTGEEKVSFFGGQIAYGDRGWVTLGGESDDTDPDLAYTAARETYEESGNRLVIPSEKLRKCAHHDLHTIKPDGTPYLYRMYMLEVGEPIDGSTLEYHEYQRYQWIPLENLMQALAQSDPQDLEAGRLFIDIDGEPQPLHAAFVKMLAQQQVQEHLNCLVQNKPYNPPKTDAHHLQSPAEKRHDIAHLTRQHGKVLQELKTTFLEKKQQKYLEVTGQRACQTNAFFKANMRKEDFKEHDLKGNIERFCDHYSAYKDRPFMTDNKALREHLNTILQQEALANSQGKLVFYHATNNTVAFLMDFFTSLRQALALIPGNQFKAFRGLDTYFDKIADIEALINEFDKGDGKINNYSRYYTELGISLNLFLFGNDGVDTSSSLFYYLENYSVSPPKIHNLLQHILINLGLEDTYIRSLINMYETHHIADQAYGGHLYQIVIDAEAATKYIYMAGHMGILNPLTIDGEETYDPIKILQALEENPQEHAGYMETLQARMLVHPQLMQNPDLVQVFEYRQPHAPPKNYTKAQNELVESMVDSILADSRPNDVFYEEPRLIQQMRYRLEAEGLSQAPTNPAASLVTAIRMGEHDTALQIITDHPEIDLVHLPYSQDTKQFESTIDLCSLIKKMLQRDWIDKLQGEEILRRYATKIIELKRLPELLEESRSFVGWYYELTKQTNYEMLNEAWQKTHPTALLDFLDTHFRENQSKMVQTIRDFLYVKQLPFFSENIAALESELGKPLSQFLLETERADAFFKVVFQVMDFCIIHAIPSMDQEAWANYLYVNNLYEHLIKSSKDIDIIFHHLPLEKRRSFASLVKNDALQKIYDSEDLLAFFNVYHNIQDEEIYRAILEKFHVLKTTATLIQSLKRIQENLPKGLEILNNTILNIIQSSKDCCEILNEVYPNAQTRDGLIELLKPKFHSHLNRFSDLIHLFEIKNLTERQKEEIYLSLRQNGVNPAHLIQSATEFELAMSKLPQAVQHEFFTLNQDRLVDYVKSIEDLYRVLNLLNEEQTETALIVLQEKLPILIRAPSELSITQYIALAAKLKDKPDILEQLAQQLSNKRLSVSENTYFPKTFLSDLEQISLQMLEKIYNFSQEAFIQMISEGRQQPQTTELFIKLIRALDEQERLSLIEKINPQYLFSQRSIFPFPPYPIEKESFIKAVKQLSLEPLEALLNSLINNQRPLRNLVASLQQTKDLSIEKKSLIASTLLTQIFKARHLSADFLTTLKNNIVESIDSLEMLSNVLKKLEKNDLDQLMADFPEEKIAQLLETRDGLTFEAFIEFVSLTLKYPGFFNQLMQNSGSATFVAPQDISVKNLIKRLDAVAPLEYKRALFYEYPSQFLHLLSEPNENMSELLNQILMAMERDETWCRDFLKELNLESFLAFDGQEPDEGIRLDKLLDLAQYVNEQQLNEVLNQLVNATVYTDNSEFIPEDLEAEYLLDEKNTSLLAKFIFDKVEKSKLPIATQTSLLEALPEEKRLNPSSFFTPKPKAADAPDPPKKPKPGSP